MNRLVATVILLTVVCSPALLLRAQQGDRVYLPVLAAPTSPTATATTQPGVSPTPTLPPPDFVSCEVVGNPSRAPNYPIRIVGIDKQAETVTLRNLSTSAIDLTGWRMCSVTGAQTHPIAGTLAPGAVRTFPGPAALIWNNSDADPGALWNPAGSLVSYWPD